MLATPTRLTTTLSQTPPLTIGLDRDARPENWTTFSGLMLGKSSALRLGHAPLLHIRTLSLEVAKDLTHILCQVEKLM